jgi:hypothetical protein
MKNKICILLIPVLIISIGLFFACGGSEAEVIIATECTVTFDANGGTFPGGAGTTTRTVARDGTLGSQYLTPTKHIDENNEYIFSGWWLDGMRYYPNTPINANITLTAKWLTPVPGNYWTVTFNANGGTDVAPLKVGNGEPLGIRCPVSWRHGFNLDGWFDGTTQYGITTPPVTSDLNLTAKWTGKTEWNVTFDTLAGNYFEGTLDSSVGTYSGGVSGKQSFTIKVYDGDGVWNRLPTTTGELVDGVIVKKDASKDILYNSLSPADDPLYYFWVQWIDADNRLYVEENFIPITGDTHLIPKWGAPDYLVPLREDPDDPVKTPAPRLVSITLPHINDPWSEDEDDDIRNQSTNLPSNPVFRVTGEGDNKVYTIWNEQESISPGRWQLMYWIELNLPEAFDIKYYNKYTVNANFYGNVKATSAWRKHFFPEKDTMMPAEFYIENIGDQLIPNRHGYGQISFCISTSGTGEASNNQTIFQQYNLGMGQEGDGGSINTTWKPSEPGTPARNPSRPQVLLIQTSDDWIGRIEVTEIRFHNDPDAVAEQE